MNIRKIAVVGGFAAGAALALAPVAAADDLTSTVDSEISTLNSLFTGEADLAGVPSTDYSLVDGFDAINHSDIGTVAPATAPFSTLDYELFGVNPGDAGVACDPGSYNVFNGALVEFDDAYNTELYALENNGALDTNTADFIGSMGTIDHALSLGTATDAAEYFLQFGLGDLQGFFDIPSL
jgi:hypothetical protein